MDEKILRNCRNRTIEDEIAVNDKYIDVITAKLKLLDKIWLLNCSLIILNYLGC